MGVRDPVPREPCRGRRQSGAEHAKTHRANINSIAVLIEKAFFFVEDTDVCRWRPTRADPLLSRSPYWWRRPRQTHLLPIGIATASPSRRFRYERNRRPRPLVPRG